MNEIFATNFTNLDWVIVAVYLMGSLVIGIVVNTYIHNTEAYIVGGRASGTTLNIATFIGTGLGLVTLMYASIDAFEHGFSYVVLALIGALVGLFLGSTGFVIRHLRSLNLMTIPEYFEKRYDRQTRILGGCICVLAGVLNMGLFPKMGATFITYVTGLAVNDGDHEMTVKIITSLLIVFVLIYTVLGGMVAVIVTDLIQFVVLSFGMGLGIYFCLSHPDLGWAQITSTMAEHRGEGMFNPIVGYGWTWITFNAFIFLAAGVCWAPEMSRALTSKDEQTTKKTFLLGSPGQFARLAIPAFWAVTAFCLVSQSTELTAHFFPEGLSGEPRNSAQAMPLVLGKIVPTGLLGLLVAGLMAAFMSTHDSYLLCWASVISRDIVSPMRKSVSDKDEIRITRISIIALGVFLLIFGVWINLPGSVWTYMAVTGSIYLSGAFTLLVGGIYWKRASSAGAKAALIGGVLSIAGLFRESINEVFKWKISGEQVGLFCFVFCAILFVAFSLVFPDKNKSEMKVA